MNVTPQDIQEMARLRAILTGNVPVSESATAPAQPQYVDPNEDMANIIRKFNAGSSTSYLSDALDDSIQHLRDNAQSDRRLRDALVTERTSSGVKMGSWEIKVNEEGTTKYYDVVNIHTKEPIANDLTLYESALALTKLLNFSVGINSPKIQEVLELENKYARVRQDAAIFRARMKQRMAANDLTRAAIAEDRYNEARTEALALRESIVSLSKRV